MRPEEPRAAFNELFESIEDLFRPADPESEALVTALICIQWRIQRYKLDEALVETATDNPDQPYALRGLRGLIECLEQSADRIHWSLLFLPRVHALDAAESKDAAAEGDGQSFLSLDTPKTRPN
jgi:hypothetical protein